MFQSDPSGIELAVSSKLGNGKELWDNIYPTKRRKGDLQIEDAIHAAVLPAKTSL